jgi:hypothetical protein
MFELMVGADLVREHTKRALDLEASAERGTTRRVTQNGPDDSSAKSKAARALFFVRAFRPDTRPGRGRSQAC